MLHAFLQTPSLLLKLGARKRKVDAKSTVLQGTVVEWDVDANLNARMAQDKKLDQLLMKAFSILDDILEQRTFLNKSLEAGFLRLAKTHCLYGADSPSTVQLQGTNCVLTPTYRVEQSTVENKLQVTTTEYQLVKQEPTLAQDIDKLTLDGDAPKEPKDPINVFMVLPPELAQQTQQVAVKFGGREVRSVCVYGGARKYDQKSELRRGADIIIATPGRLNDFLESKIISLQQCSFLVLDEADRMLDMGFEPQVRKIINSIPESSCQTLMFSATWPKEVRNLAEEFLGSYDQVNIGSVSSNPTANHSIHQVIEMCDDHGKIDKLFQYLADIMKEDERKTIIFTQTKKNVDYLTREIRKERYEVSGIHGDKTQQERDYILRSFTTGRIQVMVATDVASRGLDVDDIKYVINFDFPSSIEEYVHRIGRTGRRGREGTSISFFTKSDGRFAKDLVAIMKECNQEVDKKLEAMSYQHHGGGGNSRYGNRWGGGGGYRRNGYGGGNKSYGGGKSNGSSWGSSSNNSSWGNKSNSSYKKY
ncbi:DDX17 [Cordylochernes scorpioides]|uniref:RNA helicase n=1 Tax=Cordylochernes scorpioides TaxID=51811 RepID=A0ABY6LH29_9ARAC|nr:DDX17 [Cordylochernes scorpioides]